MIGWGPAEFREATIRDLLDAFSGWREKNGQKADGVTRERNEELKQKYG